MGRRLPKKEKTMKCMHCQGDMKKGTAPFHIYRKGYHLTHDAVPDWVCEQCGEVYFDEPEVDSIQRIIQAVEDHTKKMSAVA
jgi:YgiT-type zinc finger domain-containing protein